MADHLLRRIVWQLVSLLVRHALAHPGSWREAHLKELTNLDKELRDHQ
jgi:hypothetical protein